MIKAGIIGATGYVGIELVRLLQQHPNVTLTHAFTASYGGQALTDVYPHLARQVTLQVENLDLQIIKQHCDVVFISLPHGHAINIVPELLASGKKIIDLGADFRLKNSEDYEQWYQHAAAPDEYLAQAVYGLPEKGDRTAIRKASLIANPGCYPTATILASLPALRAEIIEPQDCIYDAKSGISGAGRTPTLTNHYCEVAENIVPYQLAGKHRHIPEIEQELALCAKQPITIQFTPHIMPMTRGLMVTAYFKLTTPLTQQEMHAIYQTAYAAEHFIRVLPFNKIPHIKSVRGSNYCDIGIYVDTRTQRMMVISVIDNLIKGAAGQAIQNMNLMYDWPEITGLEAMAIYP